MSFAYYNELWLITRSDLEKLLELERAVQKAEIQKPKALDSALSIYLRYRNLVRRLVICYDQMVQTQKRELIKQVLDCAIGRMLEYKEKIGQLDPTLSDYQWPDDILNQMKFTPDDIELLIPAVGRERIEERRKFIQELIESAEKVPMVRERSLSMMHIESVAAIEDETVKTRGARRRMRVQPSKVMEVDRGTPEEIAAREAKLAAERARLSAILLLQSHERARAGRCHGAEVKRMFDYANKVRTGEIIPKKIERAKYDKSAVTIQRAWRRYVARKNTKKRIARLEEALGMIIPSWRSRETFAKDEQNFQRRRALMPVYDAHVECAYNDERARLWKLRGPGLMEDITDEIHEWFVVWYDATGHYDVYPAAELGGSVLIATGQTATPEEHTMEKLAKKKPRKPLSCLKEANAEFIRDWSLRDESSKDLRKEVYLDLIIEKLCYELQLEIREIVDELMRAELGVLNKALLDDHKYDEEKFVIPRMEKDKHRPQKKKEKKEKLEEDVAVEEHFSELVQAKIIRNYRTVFLRDWHGDLSYQNYEARRESRDYAHRVGEVKQLVTEYCVLPLISKETHQNAPLVRSVCIYGLPGTGKTFLADAICSEVGALLFDVSVSVLADKYVGEKEQRRLVDMISKLARVYAPSIILLEAGEKPWLKKVPPEEQHLQPRRFAKSFAKLIRAIKPGDQILFLALTAEPQNASGAFIKLYDKFIMVPVPDYNTLYMYYKNLLMKYHNVDRDIDVSCLARMSVGVPLDFVRQAVEKVLSLRRRITLKFNPLNPAEIVNEILMYQHPRESVEAIEKFNKRLLTRETKDEGDEGDEGD